MSTKTLDVHTAELTTAAVEVKTLTIRGKQVTQSVFRQLQEERLLLDDGRLAGVPWGWVNWHPDKCSDGHAHIHVIWQSGSELRRARVDTEPSFGTLYCEEATEYVSIRYALLLTGIKSEFWEKTIDDWRRCRRSDYGDALFTLAEFPRLRLIADVTEAARGLPDLPQRYSYENSTDCLSKLQALEPSVYEADRRSQIRAYEEQERQGGTRGGTKTYYASLLPQPLDERIAAAQRDRQAAIDAAHEAALAVHDFLFGPGRLTADEARAALLPAVTEEATRRARIKVITRTMTELPQLFIAV